MNLLDVNIYPLGPGAVTVEFGRRISEELNEKVRRLDRRFERKPFPGLIEIVPAYASLTIFFDLSEIRRLFPEQPTAFAAVRRLILEAIDDPQQASSGAFARTIEIPVIFDADSALDLGAVAASCGLSVSEVIGIFLGRTYRVYMLGFLPGFAYLGDVDERIATPRRARPRFKTPKGSVGIAGRQTGIYPLESPGGWQIIGRTETELFTPFDESPSLLRAGDLVRFYAA